MVISLAANATEHIKAYNTYEVPPFRIGQGPSLARSLIEQLNAHLSPDYEISLEDVSRMRLNMTELVHGNAFDGIALFLHPVFASDAARSKYIWSHPLFVDCNIVVSNAAHPIDYDQSQSLLGKTFGGIEGYHYLGIDELVAAGKVRREDSRNELTNLRKIAAGRIDAMIMPYSIYWSTVQGFEEASRLSIAPKPQSCFNRYILIGKGRSPRFVAALNAAIDEVKASAQWQAVLLQVGFDTNRIDAWARQVTVQ
jgi:polar amino acid transport system substrate-binding protein